MQHFDNSESRAECLPPGELRTWSRQRSPESQPWPTVSSLAERGGVGSRHPSVPHNVTPICMAPCARQGIIGTYLA